jgi:hypothetical protein
LLPLLVRQVALGLRAPQLPLKLFDLQCQQAVEQTQFLVSLLKKPNLLGECCGSDLPADLAVDQFADKVVITYPCRSYRI